MNVKGYLFAVLMMYSSTAGGIFMLAPLLPVAYILPPVGRKLIDIMIWIWKLYAVAVYEKLCGVHVVLSGKPMSRKDGGLLIMNHRTRCDWLFLLSYQLRCGSLKRFKISLKDVLKKVPGPGWAMQIAGYIFLNRKWQVDQLVIRDCLNYFYKVNIKPQILLFPEGTDLSAQNKIRSDQFAEEKGLQKFDYVLHPKTTGFIYMVEQMKNFNQIDSIVDVTIAYSNNIPQNELDILKGNFPSEVHIHAQSYNMDTIPQDKELWCKQLWREKELKLKNFYIGNKCFESEPVDKKDILDEAYVNVLLWLALIYWTCFQIIVTYLFLSCVMVRWFVFIVVGVYVVITKYGGMCKFFTYSTQ